MNKALVEQHLTPNLKVLTLGKERLEAIMARSTLTSKGQVTIPVEIREQLGLEQGSVVDFLLNEDGTCELRPVTGSIQDIKGMVKWDGPPVTIEEMNQAIADAVMERYKRSSGDA